MHEWRHACQRGAVVGRLRAEGVEIDLLDEKQLDPVRLGEWEGHEVVDCCAYEGTEEEDGEVVGVAVDEQGQGRVGGWGGEG